MTSRACADCGVIIPATSNRCDRHRRAQVNAKPHNPLYDTPHWRRLRKRLIGRHVARYGYLCPGWERPPHLAARLSVDHVVPDALGGERYDADNLQVLCTLCNRVKGTSIGRASFDDDAQGRGTPLEPSRSVTSRPVSGEIHSETESHV